MLMMWGGGPISMGRPLALWFVYLIVIALFAGHIADAAIASGADHNRVFHVVALTSFMGYALALWQMTIWYGRSLSITIKATIDGLIYALVTAGIFVWLWPM